MRLAGKIGNFREKRECTRNRRKNERKKKKKYIKKDIRSVRVVLWDPISGKKGEEIVSKEKPRKKE